MVESWQQTRTHRSTTRAGMTLVEVLVMMTILGIITTAVVGNFTVAMQRQRWDAARDVLLTIAAGEAVYASLNTGTYYPNAGMTLGGTCADIPLPPAPFTQNRCLSYCNPTTAACRAGWAAVYMQDPNLADPPPAPPVTRQVRYRVYTRAAPQSVRAEAVLNGLVLVVDENRSISGTWTRP